MSIKTEQWYTKNMDGMVSLLRCNSRLEAEMTQALLQSAGIASFVTADDVGGMYGLAFTLTAAGGAQVFVAAAELKAAQQIINSPPDITKASK